MREVITDIDEIDIGEMVYREQRVVNGNISDLVRFYYLLIRKKYNYGVLELIGIDDKMTAKFFKMQRQFIIITKVNVMSQFLSKISKKEVVLNIL
jgi:hypothetical protein